MPWRTRRRACQTCGALAEDGIFCRMCGSRLEDAEPADGKGAPRLLRSARSLLPGLTAAAFVAFVVLMFVLELWIVGAVAVVVAALVAVILLLLQKWAEQPRSPVTEVRDRARFALAFVQVRSSVRRRVAAIDTELHRLQARRQTGLLALGEAAYGGDDAAISEAREDVQELDEEIERQHDTRRRVVEDANAFIERERGFVEPTQVGPPTPEGSRDVEPHAAPPTPGGSRDAEPHAAPPTPGGSREVEPQVAQSVQEETV